jgi:hypothetical protein
MGQMWRGIVGQALFAFTQLYRVLDTWFPLMAEEIETGKDGQPLIDGVLCKVPIADAPTPIITRSGVVVGNYRDCSQVREHIQAACLEVLTEGVQNRLIGGFGLVASLSFDLKPFLDHQLLDGWSKRRNGRVFLWFW